MRSKRDQELPPQGPQRFLRDGSLAGIQPKHATRIEVQLTTPNLATTPDEMNIAGWNLHPLKGKSAGLWAIKVNGNWRITFGFEGSDAILVDLQDYH